MWEPAARRQVMQHRRRAAIFMGIKPNSAPAPKTMKARIVTTLMIENQNSPSANTRVLIMLRMKIARQNIRHQSQTGDCGNQYCMQNPAAVRLEPRATVQVSQ